MSLSTFEKLKSEEASLVQVESMFFHTEFEPVPSKGNKFRGVYMRRMQFIKHKLHSATKPVMPAIFNFLVPRRSMTRGILNASCQVIYFVKFHQHYTNMIELLENIDLRDYTVIVPSVCVGNVGQLASDLLISSLNLQKLGYVWHPSVLTFAGTDPFANTNKLSTGCELFYSKLLKLIVFQIRSAIVKNKNNFIEFLCAWFKNNSIRQVIILSGSSAHERRDQQLKGEPVRYVFCPLTKAEEEKDAESRNWIELEKQCGDFGQSVTSPTYIPGAGITVKLFNNCVKEKIQCAILLEFCSDGNNAPDALKLVDYLNEWLELKKKLSIDNWVIPPSWNLLFGPLPPTEIFN